MTAGCKVCGQPRPRTAILHGDPYCSVACCREANGIPFDPPAVKGGKKRAA